MTFSSSEIRILFVQRARDTDAHVRIAVYQRIIKDMEEITEFTLEQVVYLLKAGLSDR